MTPLPAEDDRSHPWYSHEQGDITRIAYSGSPDPTLGIEVELQIVDPETGNLAPGGPAIIEAFGEPDFVKPELLQATVEVNVGPCDTVAEAREGLTERVTAVRKVANDLGYDLLSAGTHPFARWDDQEITDNQRYQHFLDRMQWPVRRLMIFGLHVHVGVSDGEKAIAISNAMTTFLPHLLALSASSPLWYGEDTGLASVRVKIFETLPTAGLPFRMINWGEFQRFMNTLINARAIESIREIWWDIRPHPIFGTLEVRIADAMPTMTETIAMAAFIQCLIVRLGDLYDHGDFLPTRRQWIVAENKWRAARYSDEAMIISDETGTLQRMDENIHSLVDRLEPVSKRLGCPDELQDVRRLLEVRPSYYRQRQVFNESGSRAVVDYLVNQLIEDKPFEGI
jgi:carboxylate-amine ligase